MAGGERVSYINYKGHAMKELNLIMITRDRRCKDKEWKCMGKVRGSNSWIAYRFLAVRALTDNIYEDK